MSVHWTIDYGHVPILVRADCTLVLCERTPHEGLWHIAQRQIAWWNRQTETVRVYGQSYNLRFQLWARMADARDPTPGPSDPIWTAPDDTRAIERAFERGPSYFVTETGTPPATRPRFGCSR